MTKKKGVYISKNRRKKREEEDASMYIDVFNSRHNPDWTIPVIYVLPRLPCSTMALYAETRGVIESTGYYKSVCVMAPKLSGFGYLLRWSGVVLTWIPSIESKFILHV